MTDAMDKAIRKIIADARAQAFEEAAKIVDEHGCEDETCSGDIYDSCYACTVRATLSDRFRAEAKRAREG